MTEPIERAAERLVENELVFPGLHLTCGFCGVQDWYPLTQVGRRFRCLSCLEEQGLPARPEWRYRLHETVVRIQKKNQDLTLLALARLQSEAIHSFVWHGELEMYNSSDARPIRDLDAMVVSDGQVMVGEFTKRDFFPDSDVDKMLRIARALDAAWIVFATDKEDLSPRGWRTVADLQSEVWAEGIAVDVLLGTDLLRGRGNRKQHALKRYMATDG